MTPGHGNVALPFLAFSCRQIPSTVTGFSPFELLYSHDVRGPLQVVHDAWTGKLHTLPSKRSVVEYLTTTQNHLKRSVELATEHAKQVRQKTKEYYDKKSSNRVLEPGQEVLLLRHSTENKLLAKWDGPFPVTRKLSAVNYEILTDNGPKTYHINLLKLWHARDPTVQIPRVSIILTAEPCEGDYETLGGAIDDDERRSDQLDFKGEGLSERQRAQIQDVLIEFKDRFVNRLGRTSLVQHKIRLTTDKPVAPKSYGIPESLKDQVHQQIKEMIRDGIIEPSESPYASPIVCVRKKDKSIRICADLRQLNAITIADEYPASDMRAIIDKAAGAKYITGLDLQQAFFQVELDEQSRPYTSFKTPFGLFQYCVLPNGAKNSSKCFQRLADKVLRGAEGFAAAHVDDFIIFSHTWDQHLLHIREVLTRLREANLTVKIQKCQFGMKSIKILGHIITDGVIKPDPEKTTAIANYPVPKTKRQVRAFLGLGNFYNRFIPDFGTKAAPLTELTRKDQPDRVKWTDQAQKSFTALKDRPDFGLHASTP